MTIRLNIQADVIDISTDTPQPEDVFLVDTNVWLWQTYPNATLNADPRVLRKSSLYSGYLNQALQAGAQLKYSGLTLAELAHVIEKKEYEIFKNQNRLSRLSPKAFRHNYDSERQAVAMTVQSAWAQVISLASSADVTIDATVTSAALQRFQTQALDGYDLFLMEAISRAGLNPLQVLTDDMDYACVPNIQLFTGNGLVIQEAGRQNKLIQR
ncbi:MAG: hypothetical protein AAFR58_19355 [Cyanobacteria bacterium J06627_28]